MHESGIYPFDEDFQNLALSMMVQDPGFLRDNLGSIDHTYFTGTNPGLFVREVKRWFCANATIPIFEVAATLLRDVARKYRFGDEQIHQLMELTSYCYNRKLDQSSADYARNKMAFFARHAALFEGLQGAFRIWRTAEEDVELEDAYRQISDAYTKSANLEDLGVTLMGSLGDLPAKLRASSAYNPALKVPTGIMSLDAASRGGPGRQQVWTVIAPPGGGKCLSNHTLTLMHDGRLVKAGDVKVGDLLMGPDSTPRRVLSVHTGEDEMYRIVPIKGDPWECNSRHTLSLVSTDTSEIVDIDLDDYLAKGKWFKERHKLFRTGVDFPPLERPLPLDPYFYGVWLGDGTKALNGVCVTKGDAEVYETCEKTAKAWGLKIRIEVNSTGCPSYHLSAGKKPKGQGPNVGWNSLLTTLRSMWPEVPHDYLVSSRKERLEFLAGLLDTDEYVHNGGFDIIQKNKNVADAICFVARSLGLRALMYPKHVKGYEDTYWRISISGDCSIIPTRIPRKQAPKRKQTKNVLRTGFKVEPLGWGSYVGFEVDGDNRFLLGDFTVTHNSVYLVNMACAALRKSFCVVYFTLGDLHELDVVLRVTERFTGLSDFEILDPDPSIYVPRINALGRKNLNLWVKYYPSGVATVDTLRAYLSKLKAVQGVEPALVIVDYPEEMADKHNAKMGSYQSVGMIYSGLIRIADDFNCLVWTGSQPQRTGFASSMDDVLDQYTAADSWKKVHKADGIVSLNQTKEERNGNTGRLFTAKIRRHRSRFTISVAVDFDHCRIAETSPCEHLIATPSAAMIPTNIPILKAA